MGSAVQAVSRLHIERLRAHYLVPSDHPTPETVKVRLDEAVVTHISGALSTILARMTDPDDPTVCLIRQLQFDLDLNVASSADHVAKCWAGKMAKVLGPVLQGTGDGQYVLRFENWAAYLARFLVDVAEGHAWGKWYYRPFEGLRLLTVSVALRTAVCDQPEDGLSALCQLSANELTTVLDALSVHDARRIVESLADAIPSGDAFQCFDAVWSAWKRGVRNSFDVEEEGHAVLRLYLEACRERADVGGPSLKAAAQPASGLRQTPFGGIFFLLPLLDELSVEEATHGWPAPADTSTLALVRFLLLMKGCGRSRAEAVFHDPLVRDVMGISPTLSPDTVADWQECVTPESLQIFAEMMDAWWQDHQTFSITMKQPPDDVSYFSLPKSCGLSYTVDRALSGAARILLHSFARRLPGFSTSTPSYLYKNFLDCRATLEEEQSRRVVRLSRPPLHLILNINGMTRKSYCVSWLDDRPFTLFPEE